MTEEFHYNSCGAGKIHGYRWIPEGEIRGIVQIVHGIAEHAGRYEPFAKYLNSRGFLVVAEDHMGHGKSVGADGTVGYFHGGWFSAVKDTYNLMLLTKKAYPDLPYIILGHSMGSFMTRTLLQKYPECGLSGCILCGTGAMPDALLHIGLAVAKQVCKKSGADKPNERLQNLIFGSFNKKIEHCRTSFDWLCRDPKVVDAYIKDPMCGFVACAGLIRDMISGMLYIQKKENLAKMNKSLPVRFISGKDDPVGAYGSGVNKVVKAFEAAGMRKVSSRLYPLCRHELLNEINKEEIYQDTAQWIEGILDSHQ